MFRIFLSATALFLVSFAAEALPANFDRTLCVTAVLDASKVTKCVSEAAKMRKEKGEIYAAHVTCKMYAVPDRRLACYEYAVDNLDVDRERIRGACNIIAKPNFKGTCLMQHLADEYHEKRKQEQEARQAPSAPARGSGGSVR